MCPCGSVVEHALGKGEIVGSILTMGSILVLRVCELAHVTIDGVCEAAVEARLSIYF
jgi:hypothetical protein